MKIFDLIVLIACFAAGCCPCLYKPEQKEPKKSVARETIDGFTGKTALDNLKRARPEINAAHETGKQKREDIDELTRP